MRGLGFRPLADRVLVQLEDAPTRTGAGLYIPESASGEQRVIARVVKVGPGRLLDDGTREPPEVVEGDRVIIPRIAGEAVRLQFADFRMVRACDLLGVVEE